MAARFGVSGTSNDSATVKRRALPLQRPPIVSTLKLRTVELKRIRDDLRQLLSNENTVDTARPLRLLTRAMRRGLALRSARGDSVHPTEVTELMQLELRIDQLEMLERLRDLTREPPRSHR